MTKCEAKPLIEHAWKMHQGFRQRLNKKFGGDDKHLQNR